MFPTEGKQVRKPTAGGPQLRSDPEGGSMGLDEGYAGQRTADEPLPPRQ